EVVPCLYCRQHGMLYAFCIIDTIRYITVFLFYNKFLLFYFSFLFGNYFVGFSYSYKISKYEYGKQQHNKKATQVYIPYNLFVPCHFGIQGIFFLFFQFILLLLLGIFIIQFTLNKFFRCLFIVHTILGNLVLLKVV